MSIFIPARPVAPMKAGPIGPGAGVLLTEYPLQSFLGKDPHQKMRTAYAMGLAVPWIRTAERLIGGKISTVDFDLNDPEGVEIDATYPSADAVAAWALLDKPQALLGIGQPLSRSSLLKLFSRHLGLAGNAFFLQDQPEAYSGTPRALAYLRPDRLTPNEDASGNLISWQIDKSPQSAGIEVSLEQIVHFMLEPPDSGHFGPGLVESALLMAQLSQSLDRHLASVLSAGGRLSGFISPKSGTIPDETMAQMQRDWRTITEQPDAAKRLQLIAAPIDFTHTTMTPDQIALVELMKLMRDDLFIAWNIPGSLVGVTVASGLGGGESRKYDEAALWQGPVHDRLVTLREGLQDSVLSKWQKRLGWTPELILEEPEFDDDSPRYDLLGKSINIAMRNRERRELIGLDPFGDPMLDDAVWLPATMVPAFSAIEGGTLAQQMAEPAPTGMSTTQPETSDAALNAAGETTMGKANLAARVEPLRRSLLAVRESMTTYHTPRVREAVHAILVAQRQDIAQRIRAHAEAITRKPRDASVWWDGKRWDREMTHALAGALTGMAVSVSGQVAAAMPPAPSKAAPLVVERVLLRGAARVTKINQTTRDQIASILATAIEQQVALSSIADALENGSDLTELIGSSGGVVGDIGYRSEMIARTELMDAYNASALGSYADAGIELVEAVDGDEDEECADRLAGNPYTIEEADTIEDHPNGTLDWVPVWGIDEGKARVDRISALLSEVKADEVANQATLQRTMRDVAKAMTAQAERPTEPVVVMPPQVSVDTALFAAAIDRLTEAFRTQPAPQITVTPASIVFPERKPVTKTVTRRDENGLIAEWSES